MTKTTSAQYTLEFNQERFGWSTMAGALQL